MVDAFDNGFTACYQAGDDEAGGGAQIGCHHGCAGEFFHTVYESGIAFGGNIRTHAVELGNVHEAVFKNGFNHFGRTFRHSVHGHKLSLHVGGEAGMFGGADVYRFRPPLHIDGNPVVARFDKCAGFHQFV